MTAHRRVILFHAEWRENRQWLSLYGVTDQWWEKQLPPETSVTGEGRFPLACQVEKARKKSGVFAAMTCEEGGG